MKKILLITLIFVTSINLNAKKPKLVIGIVVDQMRYDYIDRFWEKFEKNLKI